MGLMNECQGHCEGPIEGEVEAAQVHEHQEDAGDEQAHHVDQRVPANHHLGRDKQSVDKGVQANGLAKNTATPEFLHNMKSLHNLFLFFKNLFSCVGS